jgi:hypothetical protein
MVLDDVVHHPPLWGACHGGRLHHTHRPQMAVIQG